MNSQSRCLFETLESLKVKCSSEENVMCVCENCMELLDLNDSLQFYSTMTVVFIFCILIVLEEQTVS